MFQRRGAGCYYPKADLLLWPLFALATFTTARSQVISTFAGSDINLAQPGLTAVNTRLTDLGGMAVDPDGNLAFIHGKNVEPSYVVSITSDGFLKVLAGTGKYRFCTPATCPVNDGLPATQASFRPYAIAWDPAGNLFVSDGDSCRIRKVTRDGIITTIAGNGKYGFSGDGGLAVNAQIGPAFSLATDKAGNLYFYEPCRVRRIGTDGKISTVAGNGKNVISGDGGLAVNAGIGVCGIAVDASNDIYLGCSGPNSSNTQEEYVVRRITSDGIINAFAGGAQAYAGDGGPALKATFSNVESIAVDGQGNVFVADALVYRLRKIAPSGIITTFAGNGTFDLTGDGGPASQASLLGIGALAVDKDGNVYAAGYGHIRKITPDGLISTVAGYSKSDFAGDGGPATRATFQFPSALARDAAGNIYVVDTGDRRVRKITPDGIIRSFAGNGRTVASGDGVQAVDASFSNPVGIAVDPRNNVYISDAVDGRIRKVTPDGVISTLAGNGKRAFSGDGGDAAASELNLPYGMASDTKGNLFIADSANQRVRRISPDGVISTVAGNGIQASKGDGGLATNAALGFPHAVTTDALGNLYISEENTLGIRKVSSDGKISTVAGEHGFGFGADGTPAIQSAFGSLVIGFSVFQLDLACDDKGSLFLSDVGNGRVRSISPDGIINTFAGNGAQSFSGDGGRAISASLNNPQGLLADITGDLYIADVFNKRIRRVSVSLTIAANTFVNGASFTANGTVAPGEFLSIFAPGLASGSASADTTPLPIVLNGVSVKFKDSAGNEALAGIQFVSPAQVNLVVPAVLQSGPATMTITTGNGQTAGIALQVNAVAPGLFTANSTGTGVAAASAVRVDSQGKQTPLAVFQCSADLGCVSVPIDLGTVTDQTFVTLFGTGIRVHNALSDVTVKIGGQNAPVLFAGAQGTFAGLDQINVKVPLSLRGRGEVDLVLTVGLKPANTVRVRFH